MRERDTQRNFNCTHNTKPIIYLIFRFSDQFFSTLSYPAWSSSCLLTLALLFSFVLRFVQTNVTANIWKFVTQFMNTRDRKVNCFSSFEANIRDAQKQLHKNSRNRVFQTFLFLSLFSSLHSSLSLTHCSNIYFHFELMWNSAASPSHSLLMQCCEYLRCSHLIVADDDSLKRRR